MVAENDTCEKCSRILMVVEQINCGAPGQVAMNVTVLCTMCTAHDIIWLFYYSTFKCKNIFTFHIFGFALSMLRHGRESEKTMSHAPLLSGNSRPEHCQTVNLNGYLSGNSCAKKLNSVTEYFFMTQNMR